MKLRYFLTSILACLALAIGCTQEELPGVSEIQVTPSLFTLGVDGGSKEVTVTAVGAWDVTNVPDWLTVSSTSGNGSAEGEKVTITAAASTLEETRTAFLKFNCAGKTTLVTVNQDAFVPDFPAFAEGEYWIVFDGGAAMPLSSAYGYLYTAPCTVAEDGSLSSTAANIFTFKAVEGGFTIQDPAGQYYCLSGTYDSFNVYAELPATGGVWTVQQTGEKSFVVANVANGKTMQYDPNYSSAGAYASERGSLPYLVSVAGAEVAEVLFAIENKEYSFEKEAGEFVVEMICKNEDLEIKPSADWISLKGMTSKAGEYEVTFAYAANEAGARSATIDFVSNGETITVEVEQAGSIAEVSVADFLAKEEGAALYMLTGKVANLKTGDYGNFDLVDATGSVYVYGLTATPVEKNDKSFPTLGIKEGDIVTLVGTRTSYDGTAQVGGPAYYISHVGHTEVTVADFLAKEVGDARYKLTGTITNLQTGDYGNFDLVDETGSVLVYGLTVAPVAKNDKSFPTLGLKEGDKVTLIGTRAEYKGDAQVGGPAYYISHEAAGGEDTPGEGGGDTPDEPATPSTGLTYELGSSAYDDGVATVNGVENTPTIKIGTSSKTGSFTLTIPAGTKKISCYAVCWNDLEKATVTISLGDTVVATQDVKPNAGAAGQSPYTIEATEADKYTFDFPVETETKVVVSADKRVIFWGLSAE